MALEMIEIMRYEGSMAARWDELVSSSRNGTFLHQRGYMDYHSDRFTDCSLVALREGKPCALLPACIDSDVLYSHRGLTYGGWLVPLKHFDATVMIEIMDAAVECGGVEADVVGKTDHQQAHLFERMHRTCAVTGIEQR